MLLGPYISSIKLSYLQELTPKIQKAEPAAEYNIPIGDSHVKVQTFLPRVLSIVKGKVVEIFEPILIFELIF